MVTTDLNDIANQFFSLLPKTIANQLKKTHWGLNIKNDVVRFSIDCNNEKSFEEIKNSLEELIDYLQDIVDLPIEGGIFYCKKKPDPCGNCDRLGCGIEYFTA